MTWVFISPLYGDIPLPPCPGADPSGWSACAGRFSWADGGEYTGGWLNGKPDGKGVFTWSNGDVYVGQWRNGQREGKGEYNLRNAITDSKDNYVGGFKNGEFGGSGIYTWADGGRYVGFFSDGTYKGKGVLVWSDGRRLEADFSGGSLLRRAFHGSGVMVWPSGATYTGEWRDGLRNGHGTMTFLGGEKYVGEWVADKQNGQGTHFYPNGDRYVGRWSRGQREGEGVLFGKDGKPKEVGSWSRGSLVKASSDAGSSDFSRYKENCLELGFREKTEPFGECVLELSRRAQAEAALAKSGAFGDGDPDDSTCRGSGFAAGTSGYDDCRQQLFYARSFYERELREYERAKLEYEKRVAAVEAEDAEKRGQHMANLGLCVATCTGSDCVARCSAGASAMERSSSAAPKAPSGVTTYVINGRPISCTATAAGGTVVICN